MTFFRPPPLAGQQTRHDILNGVLLPLAVPERESTREAGERVFEKPLSHSLRSCQLPCKGRQASCCPRKRGNPHTLALPRLRGRGRGGGTSFIHQSVMLPRAQFCLSKRGTSTQCEVAVMLLRSPREKVREGILVRFGVVLSELGRNKIPSENCRVELRSFRYGYFVANAPRAALRQHRTCGRGGMTRDYVF